MIKHLTLKFGRSPEIEPEQIETTPVTVFVGPNNSGKSKLLSEINHFCNYGKEDYSKVILKNLEFCDLSPPEAGEMLKSIEIKPNYGETIQPDNIFVGNARHRNQVPRHKLFESLKYPNSQTQRFCSWFLIYKTLILDGENRITLINQQEGGDLQQAPTNTFQLLFSDDDKRKELRRIIYDAFSLYLVIDPTNRGKLRLRLSLNQPTDDIQERGLHHDAVQFHSQAMPIEDASDGVKAFTGMMTEIVAGDPKIILIDDPEAFLHPSLSFKLGKEISLASRDSDKRLFVSTHSSNFVLGCIQSGVRVNIVRLTYSNNTATARVLPNQDILRLMRNPLLRSTGVLEGLFYESVVITESDTDRAFYQEVNERLLRYKPELAIPNCLFINAQNKQTIQTIIRPLRELGIPAVGILDIDILKDGGSNWTNFLESGFIPKIEHRALAQVRNEIKKKFDNTKKNMKREGVKILEDSDKEAANNLFDKLAEYGLFIVRDGELEFWLQNLGVEGHGPKWLIEIFEKMGEDPDNPNYLKPSEDDIWAFIGKVRLWCMNATRKGIPQ